MKTIFITGGTSGIGKSLAKQYLDSGNRVFVTGRTKEKIEELSMEWKNYKNFFPILVDVTNKEHMEQTLHDIDNKYTVDIIIANAGVSSGVVGDGKKFDQIGREIYDVNVFGVFNTIHPLIDNMKTRGSGSIVIISSMSAFLPLKSALFYASSKSAIGFYAHGLSMLMEEYGIFVSVVFPGFVRSNITDKNNFQMPFLMDSQRAASIIIKGIDKKNPNIIFPKILYFIVYAIGILPFSIQRKILIKLPNK